MSLKITVNEESGKITAYITGKKSLLKKIPRSDFIRALNAFPKIVRRHIDRQDLKVPKLAASTIRRKKGETRVYYETGELYRDIGVHKYSSDAGQVLGAWAGWDAKKVHKPSNTTYGVLLKRLMYGWGDVPGRDLITPSIKEWKKRIWNPYMAKMKRDFHKTGTV
jgi:hypothetical protein